MLHAPTLDALMEAVSALKAVATWWLSAGLTFCFTVLQRLLSSLGQISEKYAVPVDKAKVYQKSKKGWVRWPTETRPWGLAWKILCELRLAHPTWQKQYSLRSSHESFDSSWCFSSSPGSWWTWTTTSSSITPTRTPSSWPSRARQILCAWPCQRSDGCCPQHRVYQFSSGRAESRWPTLSAVPRTDIACTASTAWNIWGENVGIQDRKWHNVRSWVNSGNSHLLPRCLVFRTSCGGGFQVAWSDDWKALVSRSVHLACFV